MNSQVRASARVVYYCTGCYPCHQAAHRASIHWAVKPNGGSDLKVSVLPLSPMGGSLQAAGYQEYACFSEQVDLVLRSLNLGLGFNSKRLAYKG